MWIRTFNIAKMPVLSNLMYRFISIPTKIPASYFVNIDNCILKYICIDKRLSIASGMREKKMGNWFIQISSLIMLSFSRSVMSDSLWPHRPADQFSLSTISWSLLELMSTESVMPSNHLIPWPSSKFSSLPKLSS